jgi:multidrug efflux pump subunit AcrB
MGITRLIDLFAQHRVAGNLLMVLMIVFGIYGLTKLNRQVMPNFTLEIISITVQWPGASPQDVEANILAAIEPEVQYLDNVKLVEAIAYEGRGEVTITFKDSTDISKALADVQAAMAQIVILPTDSEKPVIRQVVPAEGVCRLLISGPFPEQALKLIAKRVRDELLSLGMTEVRLVGARDSEIWVEVSSDALRRLDLTVDDIADRIEQESIDLPAGSIKSGTLSMQLRSESLARSAGEVADIEVISEKSGEKLRLKDIAQIYETFEENSVSNALGENVAIGLVVSRGQSLDAMKAQKIVANYVDEIQPSLPPTLNVVMYNVMADEVSGRVEMLVENGLSGLVLVLAVLFLFMNGRIAFWIAMGIPVTVLATLGGMALIGLTLDMVTMFAIIMGLGIIVDDAIVVGDHTQHLHQQGLPADVAALQSARLMLAPVMAATLTTIATFLPLLAIGAQIGMILRGIPLVIIIVLFASVIECFLVLPMHLKHALRKMDEAPAKEPGRFEKAYRKFAETTFTRWVDFCFQRRYSTLLATIALFSFAIILLVTGRVNFEFFVTAETNMAYGNFSMTPGTVREETALMLDKMAEAAHRAEDRLTDGNGGLIAFEVGTIGTSEARAPEPVKSGDHNGVYTVELVGAENRQTTTMEFNEAWADELEPIAGLQQLTIFEDRPGGPGGNDVDIRLHGASLDVLKAAAMDLREQLRSVPGVLAIEDNLPYGKQEAVIELTPDGRAMGFTSQSVARQVRNAYEGAVAKRFSRDQEEIIVRVKQRATDNLANTIRDFYLRSPDGDEVPLTEVALLNPRIGFSQIRREDGLRQVSVSGNIDPYVTTTNEVVNAIEQTIVPQVRQKYGIDVEFKGKSQDQAEAFADMQIAATLAFTMMYVVLAWVFQSYATPLVVMAMIPFGLTGAIFGHYVTGHSMSMLGFMAFLGLAGVLVNDSIILMASIKRAMTGGTDLREAVRIAARDRLRPILVTTLTTIGGLLPLMFETSTQAQLVQPLAVTLIFGLLYSPFLVMFFVPALLGIGSDLGFRRNLIPMDMEFGTADGPATLNFSSGEKQ